MLELQRPSLRLIDSYLEFILEMKNLGETIWEGQLPKAKEISPLHLTYAPSNTASNKTIRVKGGILI